MSRVRVIKPLRCLKSKQLRAFTTSSNNLQDFTHLQKELPNRDLSLVSDFLVPTPSHLLNVAITDILPAWAAPKTPKDVPQTTDPTHLPPAHHLIYFPPPIPGSDLLPDGTDPLQSPGDPFVRRMWAGGSLLFNNTPSGRDLLTLDGRRASVLESIRDVSIKGAPGTEKIFVGIERRVGSFAGSPLQTEAAARSRLWRDDPSDFGPHVGLIERRNIVFMRERSAEQARVDNDAARAKQLRPLGEGPLDFEAAITPDARLLFRYSALTYNAHAIHLNPQYCREVEGHRGMLVHGPLSFTFMMTLLNAKLRGEKRKEVIRNVEYRNLAPLYCDEPLKVAGRRLVEATKESEGKWEVWVETPEGGLAVKGTVKTELLEGGLDAMS